MVSMPQFSLTGKPTYVKISEDIDFFDLFRVVESEHNNCFLFESLGEESAVSRYHAMGFDPAYIVAAPDKNTLRVEDARTGQIQTYPSKNPYYDLRQWFPHKVVSKGYAGGLVGFLGYDAVNFFESSLDIKSNPDFEPFKFGVYLDGLVFDQVTGEVFYYYYEHNRIELIEQYLAQPPKPFGATRVKFLGNTMTKEQHAITVEKVKEDIRAGLIFQCEVGFKSLYTIQGDTLQIYQTLRAVNPSPHMYYLKFGQQKMVGASPELLFRLRDGEMETFPLAGTTRRGATPAEDIKLARVLLNDPKEIAEHNMLVDLHRNDIGRVAQFGTVRVRKLMDVKRYSHVQHISSEIVGVLRGGEDMFSAVAANFPAGTLTGAPKIEAMKIINSIEPTGRGPYGGAIGQYSFNGDCAFAIPIRTVFINGENAYVQTCGGNVFDSNAADEYLEIERKLAAMKSVLMSFAEA